MQTILEIGWLLMALLIPLWVNLWGSQPFDPAKLALFRWLVWLMTAVWLIDVWWRPASRRALPRRFGLPLLALALAALVSTAVSPTPSLSWWGSYERGHGLLTLLSTLLLTLIVATRLPDLAAARRLLGFMAATAVPIILLGSLQASGHDPLQLISDARSPVYATLGRANFVGAYLALLLPLTLALALTSPHYLHRLALYALAFAQLSLIAVTLARAAWLAAGVSLFLFGLGAAWTTASSAFTLSRHGRYALGGAGMLLLVGGGLLVGRGLAVAEGGSLAARRVIWRTTLELIGTRPWWGYGLDNLAAPFRRVFPPELVYYHGREVFVDRAHNWLLDTAVMLGVVGLLTLLWLWGVVLWSGWVALRRWQREAEAEKREKSREQSLLLLGCLAAVAGQLVGNLFSFVVASTAVATALLLALIFTLSQEPLPFVQAEAGRSAVRLTPWRVAGAVLLMGTAVGAGWWGNGRFLAADMAYQHSVNTAVVGDMRPSISAAQRATTYWPMEPRYWQQLAWLQGAQGDLPAAAESWDQAAALRPHDAAVWAERGQFYLRLAEQGHAPSLALAEQSLAQAVALSPNMARLYVAAGQVALLAGEGDTAVVKLNRAVALDATDPLAWSVLAEAYWAVGQSAEAQAAQQQAQRWRDE